MPATFGIVDLFAGPGGLGEGFASFDEEGHSPFRIGISVEKEASAHRTLTLRAFLREYQARHNTLPEQFVDFHSGQIPEPNWAEVDAEAWRMAIDEARALELGTGAAAAAIDAAIAQLRRDFDDTILIAARLVRPIRSWGEHDPEASVDMCRKRMSVTTFSESTSGFSTGFGLLLLLWKTSRGCSPLR